jgi:Flp pilus assembly protein TadD
VAVGAFLLGLQGLRCLDVWFHLRTGQLIWESGSVPTADSLSHTRAGADWVTHEWLFELPLWGIWQLGGDAAMVIVQAALAALTFGLLARATQRAGASELGALIGAGAGIFLASSRFLARPHMASAVFTAALLAVCFGTRDRADRRIYLLIPMFLLWANVHAGVVQGLLILGLFAAEEWAQRRSPGPLAKVAAASTVVSLLNPNGWETLWYPFFLIQSNDRGLFDIVELRPPEWPSPAHIYAGVALLAGLVAWRRLTPAIGVLALLGVILGTSRTRASLDLALYGAPVIALAVTTIAERAAASLRIGTRTLPTAAVGLVALGAILGARGYRPDVGVVPWAIPAAAMEFVGGANLGGQMLNAHLFGGWLVWAHPERKVYFDGRNEVFVSLFEETRTTPVDQLATRYDLGYAVLDYPTDREVREVDIAVDLNDVLLADPRWRLVFFDDVARVYALERPENTTTIARFGYRALRPGWSDFEYVRRYAADPAAGAVFESEARRAIEESPEAAMPRMHLVEYLRLSGRVDDALAEISAIAEEDPFRISRLGGLLLQAGRTSDARDALLEASTLLPDNAAVWSNLGLAALRLDDLATATTASKRALELDGDLLEARENLVLVLRKSGDEAGAKEQDNAIRATRLRLAREHFEAGQGLLQQGYAERASVELERAAALTPSSANTRYLLGVAYNVMGAPALAESNLRATLAAAPEHPYALLELANAQIAQNRSSEARISLLAFLDHRPEPKWEAAARAKLAALGGAP